MALSAPGEAHRKEISLKKLSDMFPDNERARAWLEEQAWPHGPYCPRCGGFNVQSGQAQDDDSPLPRLPEAAAVQLQDRDDHAVALSRYRDWTIAIYLLTTNLKGVSAMLHRDLEIACTPAWHLAHRLREAFDSGDASLSTGPTEADETHISGKRKNKMDPHGPADAVSKRRLRRAERCNSKIPHRRSPLVFSATGSFRANGGLCERTWRLSRASVFSA